MDGTMVYLVSKSYHNKHWYLISDCWAVESSVLSSMTAPHIAEDWHWFQCLTLLMFDTSKQHTILLLKVSKNVCTAESSSFSNDPGTCSYVHIYLTVFFWSKTWRKICQTCKPTQWKYIIFLWRMSPISSHCIFFILAYESLEFKL